MGIGIVFRFFVGRLHEGLLFRLVIGVQSEGAVGGGHLAGTSVETVPGDSFSSDIPW